MSLPNSVTPPVQQNAPQNADVSDALNQITDEPIVEDGADKIKLGTKTDDKEPVEDKKARRTSEQKEIDELAESLKDDEDEEVEDELEEPVDNQQVNEFIDAPRRKEILAKYPNLFKDFPGLQAAYYRDQQMKDYFATVDDAKNAVELLQEFDQFRQSMLQGDMQSVLKTVREADPNAFRKLVDNVLVNIANEDQAAYYHIMAGQTKATVQAMLTRAQQTQDQNLQLAAQYLYNFVFGTNQMTPHTNYARQDQQQQNNPEDQLQQQRQQFMLERVETYKSEIDNKVTSQFRSLIADNIDKGQQMSEWIRNQAVDQVFNQTIEKLRNDPEYGKQLNRYWERAARSNFSQESLNAIRNYVVTRGKHVIPHILVKVRQSALQGSTSKRAPKDQSPVNSGRSAASSNSGNKVDAEKIKNMDVREAFDLLGD